jgi:hypothetical protein
VVGVRNTSVRRLALVLLCVAAVAGVQGATARTDTVARVAGGITLRVPSGWRLVHGWLSDVVIPIPRLAVASFDVTLSRHTCACGMPNVKNFPATGGLVFVWEYPGLTRRQLQRVPARPRRFAVPSGAIGPDICGGPSGTLGFRSNGREFQVELYVGVRATPRTRAQLAEILDSLLVTPGPVSLPVP